jgi:hypothetical protein
VIDGEKAELQASDDEHVVRATTSSPVDAGRHVVQVVGRAPETLLRWMWVLPSLNP